MRQAYEDLLLSGMFYELYPELTGDWKTDKEKWEIIFKNLKP